MENYLIQSALQYSPYLEHHGIKGQKWGVRRTPEQLGHVGKLKKYKLETKDVKLGKTDAKHYKWTDTQGNSVAEFKTWDWWDGKNISDLEVSKAYRGQRLSYDILDYATLQLKVKNLAVRHDNDIARHVYDNYGFKVTEIDDEYEYRSYQGPKVGSLNDKVKDSISQVKSSIQRDAEKAIQKAAHSKNTQDTRVDLNAVKKRSGLNDVEAKKCEKLALELYSKAYKEEPSITKDVAETITNYGAGLHGIEHVIKTPTSIASKIGSDSVSDSISYAKAATGINDSIRYTSVTSNNNYVSAYNSVKNELERKGYTETKCKNYFQSYADGNAKHKSITSVFTNRNGQSFEIQFQTIESQAAKEVKTPIYEERRSSGITPERAAYLESQMTELAESVPNPNGVYTIKSHK